VRFAILIAFLASQSFGQSFDFRGTVDDPHVLSLLQDLAVRGAYKLGGLEVAAFIVQEPDGGFSCLLWPASAGFRSEHFSGTIPAGTVAVAHTHPGYFERPSSRDVAESKRIALPIYVVTRWNLFVVDPASGERVELIRQKDWMGRAAHHECQSLKPQSPTR
jgi:hypothetical protein